MTTLMNITFEQDEIADLAELNGVVAVFVGPDGFLDRMARRVNRLSRDALKRLSETEAFEKAPEGAVTRIAFPAGMAAEAVLAVKLSRRITPLIAQKAGAAVAKSAGSAAITLCAAAHPRAAEIAYGMALRSYKFDRHKTADADEVGGAVIRSSKFEEMEAQFAPMRAVTEGVHFTRDLVNEPANVLTTTEFAARLTEMTALGLEVEVLEEPELAKLGMGALLGVGQGSESPSKVVVMRWNGGGDEAPFALVGKGVVFDTGGISLKPAAGMEEMTMDMGGAGVVSGVMRALALRKAPANVVGVVGLVENMPDGKAQRPGDVVTSMKGDTIEVINTDAEGRLVLADILWYTQERFNPTGMINLATLTGAIIIGLGHDNAGVFSNDDALSKALLKAAGAEGEGAWRMPMGSAYDKLIKSRIADMKNVGGRAAGSITAAQFLQRFVKEGMPWAHIDIAGVALPPSETDFAPKGATGWGVRALDRLIRDIAEPKPEKEA